MGRPWTGVIDRGGRDIPDIAVDQRLAPGEPRRLLEHQDRFAVVITRDGFAARCRALSHRRPAGDDPPRPARDKPRRGDPPAQSRIGEIVAIGVEPRIERVACVHVYPERCPFTASRPRYARLTPATGPRAARGHQGTPPQPAVLKERRFLPGSAAMGLKDILVCLDPTDAGDARLRLAAALARQHQAHLSAAMLLPSEIAGAPPYDGLGISAPAGAAGIGEGSLVAGIPLPGAPSVAGARGTTRGAALADIVEQRFREAVRPHAIEGDWHLFAEGEAAD